MGGGNPLKAITDILTSRPVAAIATVGGSELSRNKPFQPGGEQRGPAEGLLSGPFTAHVGLLGQQAAGGRPPALPSSPSVSSIDQATQDAANAVQTSEAEARRARNAKRQSSVLGNYQGASATGISPATLQPAPPRKSVLG